MSAARRSGRFSYLKSTPESAQTAQTNPAEDGSATESIPTTDSSDEGEGRSPGSSTDALVSVPKGKGRMKTSELCLYKVKDGKIVSEEFFV